ncbi:MAG: hypothetical protein Q7J03_04705 [Methanoregula sp.]|nr:hypothetical protein [Methanoregula sp.]
MSECGNRHGQMRKPRRKFAQVTSKGIWIEHKGTCKVNLCS